MTPSKMYSWLKLLILYTAWVLCHPEAYRDGSATSHKTVPSPKPVYKELGACISVEAQRGFSDLWERRNLHGCGSRCCWLDTCYHRNCRTATWSASRLLLTANKALPRGRGSSRSLFPFTSLLSGAIVLPPRLPKSSSIFFFLLFLFLYFLCNFFFS
jgi:hypothetical protein